WAPFHNEGKWDLAQFLMKNISQTKINEFLKLSLVSFDSIQTGPVWTCEMIDVVGNVVGEDGRMRWEQLELW
ncbi:hypothetical protein EDC04DRAFT_2549342, partial [Pisolithus marmoratus]